MIGRRFSLLELIITLAVIALVLGMVLPQLDLLPMGVRIRDTEQKINSAFYVAAAMSQSTGAKVSLDFALSEDDRRITLTRSAPEPLRSEAERSWEDEAETLNAPTPPSIFDGLDQYKLDDKFALDEERLAEMSHETDTTFTFYPNGEADGPELAFLIDKASFTLTVDRLTGRPTLIREEE